MLIEKKNLDPLTFLKMALNVVIDSYSALEKEFFCDVKSKNWEDGLFYFLGTMSSEDKKTWKSPIPGFVTLAASSLGTTSTTYPLVGVLSTPPTGICFYTGNVNDSWVQITLTNPIQILLTDYAIRTRGDSNERHLRHWVLEGSVDGKNWNTLMTHSSDLTLNSQDGIGKWKVNAQNYLSQFRIRQNGLNSTSNYHLLFQNVEFYGKVSGI